MPSPWNNPDAQALDDAFRQLLPELRLDPATSKALEKINRRWHNEVLRLLAQNKVHGPQMVTFFASITHAAAKLLGGTMAASLETDDADRIAMDFHKVFDYLLKHELRSAQEHLRQHMEGYDNA